jgi:F-type H+-transporting ATPase subunit b
MGPDWFTVIAQIINFLILVALLKRFLYGPIIRAMERREKEIASGLDEAAKKAAEAEQEGLHYRALVREMADAREKMLAQTREEAEALRRDLKQKALEETDRSQAQWYESFRHQKEAVEQGFRLHACKQVFAVVRRALTDLADTDLEERMTDVFISRIRNLDPALQKEITDSIMSTGREIVIRSAFEINPEGQRKIVEAIRAQISKAGQKEGGHSLMTDMNINFETSGSLICGIEIVADGRKVTWDLEGYLDELEQSFAGAFENGTAGSASKITRE